jgi:hypothetical protein
MIDLVIFTNRFYKDTLLQHCIHSIDQFVQDDIASYTLISEEPYNNDSRFTVIRDREFWDLIDPNFKYPLLFEHKWFMQQIMKLSVNHLSSKNVLIVDADLLFLRPVNFVQNNLFNFYLSREYDQRFFDANRHLLGIEKQTLRKQSFISDFSIVNANILTAMQHSIEQIHSSNWIETIYNYVEFPSGLTGPTISEYEMYGNYFLSLNHKDYKHNLIDPIEYAMWYDFLISDFENANWRSDRLIDELKTKTNNFYQCIKLNPG